MVFTQTAADAKELAAFKKFLTTEVLFQKFQTNVYTREFIDDSVMADNLEKIKDNLPKSGQITIMQTTNKQYENRLRLCAR